MQLVTLRSLKTQAHPQTKTMFWSLFASSRGGAARIKIIKLLKNRPYNAHQLSKEIGMDYKGILHHMTRLEQNSLIGKFESNYGAAYFLSPMFEENETIFEEITSRLNL